MAQTFQNVLYESDKGNFFNIRISSDVAAITGNSVTGTITDGNVDVSVAHHGQKRRVGINARGVVLGLPALPPLTGYSSKTFVPIVSKTAYAALAKGGTVTYKTKDWTIVDKVAEV